MVVIILAARRQIWRRPNLKRIILPKAAETANTEEEWSVRCLQLLCQSYELWYKLQQDSVRKAMAECLSMRWRRGTLPDGVEYRLVRKRKSKQGGDPGIWETHCYDVGISGTVLVLWVGLAANNDELNRLMWSDLYWSYRISHILNMQIALKTLNAYVSTLGGGYFLCRKIDEAEHMAERQLRIAIMLGDPVLAGQCRIHLVYNCIQRGLLREAKRRLKLEWMIAHKLSSDTLKSIVRAAWVYIRKLTRIKPVLRRHGNKQTIDDLARQRFVMSR